MPTILITGCSSGFGLETARHFATRDWNVVATMRTPREDVLPMSERMRVLPLDVTSASSIADVVEAAGRIDALVNNAGIGFLNALEGTPIETARHILETNTLGTIAMMQAVLPQMRERRDGVVVNVTSSVTYRPLPLLSVYTASKAAVNAFSDSVALELEPFNVRVRVVLPGRAPTTRFGENARAAMTGGFPDPYLPLVEQVMAGWQQDTVPTTTSQDVAEAVWRVVNDVDAPAHLPAGADAITWSQAG